ncbi:MAG: maleylacetoacetate isomerase [Gammaproteobacteria bacterium]|nr:maleylacetoacetate isomerase [Gammaproteobacteria bacterium]
MSVVLYSYFRSSAAYRVRIALNLKNIDYDIHPVHLVRNGGEQYLDKFLAINPQGRVPVLVIDDTVMTQSTAIIEYLDEVYPSPALLPQEPHARAFVRSLAQVIACDIHPLNNIRVLNYLEKHCAMDTRGNWYQHWVQEGFATVEALLNQHSRADRFCCGNQLSMADIYLVPQVFNALRFDCRMSQFPRIQAIYDNALTEQVVIDAAPENQPDAE